MEGAKVGICTNCQKGLVEMAATCPHCGQADSYQSIDKELTRLIERGQETDALKRVIRLTGWEIKESREYLETLTPRGH